MYAAGIKRLFDMAAAIIALVLLSPICLAVMLAIYLSDPGPAIFRQKRVGRNGDLFAFYKFRSMPVNTAELSSDKLEDIKIGWIGRIIRRSNIDELPQLVNILKGDMSIVGPRPPLPAQTKLIELRRENGALACRPGLTGLAQVSSYDGMPVERKAAFDGQYARSVSLVMDLAIIARTFLYLLKPPPKY